MIFHCSFSKRKHRWKDHEFKANWATQLTPPKKKKEKKKENRKKMRVKEDMGLEIYPSVHRKVEKRRTNGTSHRPS